MDINELIRQNVEEVLAESNRSKAEPTATPVAPAAGPITVNIQGQPVTFRDQADLEAQLNATAAAIRQQAATPPPAPEPTGGRVTDDSGSTFSNDEYVRLMNEDPRKAQNYVLSHTLFDGKVDNAAELLRETMIQTAQANRQLAAFQFKQTHGEIPVENPQVGGVIEQARTQLGLPFTAQGLEAAYAYAVQKGALPDFRTIAAAQQNQYAAQGQPPQQQPQQPAAPNYNNFGGQNLYPSLPGQPAPVAPQNPYLQAPPTSGRSQQMTTPVTLDDLDNMSTDQLATLLNRLQGAGISG